MNQKSRKTNKPIKRYDRTKIVSWNLGHGWTWSWLDLVLVGDNDNGDWAKLVLVGQSNVIKDITIKEQSKGKMPWGTENKERCFDKELEEQTEKEISKIKNFGNGHQQWSKSRRYTQMKYRIFEISNFPIILLQGWSKSDQ